MGGGGCAAEMEVSKSSGVGRNEMIACTMYTVMIAKPHMNVVRHNYASRPKLGANEIAHVARRAKFYRVVFTPIVVKEVFLY